MIALRHPVQAGSALAAAGVFVASRGREGEDPRVSARSAALRGQPGEARPFVYPPITRSTLPLLGAVAGQTEARKELCG